MVVLDPEHYRWVCELLLVLTAEESVQYPLPGSDDSTLALAPAVARLLELALDSDSEVPNRLVEAVGFVASRLKPEQVCGC